MLPLCVEAGAESIELHAGVPDHNITMKEWNIVSESIPNGMISMCLDRYHLSNNDVIDRIKLARDVADDRLIIQADGIPMSGGTDDFNTTLQAISIADIINKSLKSVDRNSVIYRYLFLVVLIALLDSWHDNARSISLELQSVPTPEKSLKIVLMTLILKMSLCLSLILFPKPTISFQQI